MRSCSMVPSARASSADSGRCLFAGARTLQTRCRTRPDLSCRGRAPLRGRTTPGATGFIVLADYAELLRVDGGHLLLSAVGPDLRARLRHTHRVDLRDAVTVIPASETILESTQKAYDDAEEWLAVHAS
jgi:sulfate permease, SulP family